MYFLKQIFCSHDYYFVRNIYGDEIVLCGYRRSVWKCKKCGKCIRKPELNEIRSIENRWKKLVIERDEYAQSLREQIFALERQNAKLRNALNIAHAHADSLADSVEEMRIVNEARLLPIL